MNEELELQTEELTPAEILPEAEAEVAAEIVEEKVEQKKEEKPAHSEEEIRKIRNDEKNKLSPEDKVYWDMGWRPKHLFSGKNKDGSPKQWVPLEQFKEIIENNPKVKAERERALEKRMEERFEVMQHKLDSANKLSKLKLDREHKLSEEKINRDLQEAESLGDLESYKTALKQKQILEAEKAEVQKLETPMQPPADPIVSYEVENFRKRNSWFNVDKDMSDMAINQFDILNKNPKTFGLSVREKLAKVEQIVKATFSDQFQAEKKIPVPESSKGSGNLSYERQSANKQITYMNLPEDEQRRIDQLAKMKRTTRDDIIKKFYKK